MKTVSGLFDTYDQAAEAVRDLKAFGIPDGDVSMVASNAEGRYKVDDTEGAAAGAGTGAGLGAAVGGAGGLLTGLGLMAIRALARWWQPVGWRQQLPVLPPVRLPVARSEASLVR